MLAPGRNVWWHTPQQHVLTAELVLWASTMPRHPPGRHSQAGQWAPAVAPRPFPAAPSPSPRGVAGLLRLRRPLPPGLRGTSSPLAAPPLSRRQAPASLLPPLTPLQPFFLSAGPPPALLPQRQPPGSPFSLSAERPSRPFPSVPRVGPLSAYMGLWVEGLKKEKGRLGNECNSVVNLAGDWGTLGPGKRQRGCQSRAAGWLHRPAQATAHSQVTWTGTSLPQAQCLLARIE